MSFSEGNVLRTTAQLSGRNGLVDVEIRIPKSTSALNVDSDELGDALAGLLDENGIDMLDDDDVPFFNNNFQNGGCRQEKVKVEYNEI